MGRSKTQTRRKAISKIKFIAKLEYGEDYTETFALFTVVVVVILFLLGKFGLISISMAFFYAAAVQLYSGIALGQSGWGWAKKVIAKYTREQQPDLFYLNVAFWIFAGIVFSAAALSAFLS